MIQLILLDEADRSVNDVGTPNNDTDVNGPSRIDGNELHRVNDEQMNMIQTVLIEEIQTVLMEEIQTTVKDEINSGDIKVPHIRSKQL